MKLLSCRNKLFKKLCKDFTYICALNLYLFLIIDFLIQFKAKWFSLFFHLPLKWFSYSNGYPKILYPMKASCDIFIMWYLLNCVFSTSYVKLRFSSASSQNSLDLTTPKSLQSNRGFYMLTAHTYNGCMPFHNHEYMHCCCDFLRNLSQNVIDFIVFNGLHISFLVSHSFWCYNSSPCRYF